MLLEFGLEALDEDLHGFSLTKVINLGFQVLKGLDVMGYRSSLLEVVDLGSGKHLGVRATKPLVEGMNKVVPLFIWFLNLSIPADPSASISPKKESCGLDSETGVDLEDVEVLIEFIQPILYIILGTSFKGGGVDGLEEAGWDHLGRHGLRGIQG